MRNLFIWLACASSVLAADAGRPARLPGDGRLFSGPSTARVLNIHDTESRPVARSRAARVSQAVLSEDFSKMTLGSESTPWSGGIVGDVPATLTGSAGWYGATVRQAGGCVFIDDYSSAQGAIRFIDTPGLEFDSRQDLLVKFRCRSNSSADEVYVLDVEPDGETVSYTGSKITGLWSEYSLVLRSVEPGHYVEFQSSEHPFYLDDIEISVLTDLTAPKVRPATDITADGFTANWDAVAGATGYSVRVNTIRVSDGLEPVTYIDTDFSGITEGSIENPVPPQYLVESLNDYIDEKGWRVRLPFMAAGYLGLSNRMLATLGRSYLQSPVLDLSKDNGRITIDISYLTPDVDMFQAMIYAVNAQGDLTLRSQKMLFTSDRYGSTIDESFTLSGGTSSCVVIIMLPETTDGTLFIDRLRVAQHLEEGDRYIVPLPTVDTAVNSARISTAGSRQNDRFSYYVTAYASYGGNYVYSPESNGIIVGEDSDEVPEHLSVPGGISASVTGSRVRASWTPVDGANSYEARVIRRHDSDGNERVTVIHEDFDAIQVNTTNLDAPRALGEDGHDVLDDYTNVPGWEVFQGWYVDGAVGILGYYNMMGIGCYMISPPYDLSADGGKMVMNISVGSDSYGQGATIYLAHNDPETGVMIYDEMFPMDTMYGWNDFTIPFTKGTEASYFVFFPYGYGLSYFDNITVTQAIPAGISETAIATVRTSSARAEVNVPQVNNADEYHLTVRALWTDASDVEKTSSDWSDRILLTGLVPTTSYSGYVRDTDGNGIAGATVTLTENATGASYSTVTNTWGMFRIANISELDGSFNVTASAPGHYPATITGVTFDGGAVADADLRLRSTPSENDLQLGAYTGTALAGSLYLSYPNSDSQTIYPAEVIPFPADTEIKTVAVDGYCNSTSASTISVDLYMAQTDDCGFSTDEPEPYPTDEMEPAASASVTVNTAGSADMPEELFAIACDGNGYTYTGGNLLVAFKARSKSYTDVYMAVDASRPGTSIHRYWTSRETDRWRINPAGMPVIRVTYRTPSGIGESAITPILSVTGGNGTIEIRSTQTRTITVYRADGTAAAHTAVTAGHPATAGPLAPGIYIVEGIKVCVR